MDVSVYIRSIFLLSQRLNLWTFMTVSGILEQHLILGQWAESKAFPWKIQSLAALVPSHSWLSGPD